MKESVLVFALFLAGAVAHWHGPSGERKSAKVMESPASEAEGVQLSCQPMMTDSEKLNNGFTITPELIHLCPTRNGGLCYSSRLKKCCEKNDLVRSVKTEVLTVGGLSVAVSVLYVGQLDSCIHFGSQHGSIGTCPVGGAFCIAPGCETPLQICTNNSVGSCDSSGCATCKPGYKRLRCCECEENYQRAEDGSCKFVCQTNCRGSNGQCTSCAHPYSGSPFCCDCVAPFVKGENGVCRCADGYYETGGTCEPICSQNTVPCANPPCCKTGFKKPLCCECIFDEIGDGESYFQFGGQCKKICKANALKENCNVISGCSECEDSFKPSDCCECEAPKKLVDGVCRFCPLDQVVVDGKCKPFCDGHVVLGSCDGAKCQCLAGYIGNDCCKCAPAYVQDGNNCRPCPTGTVPDANQEKCLCDQSQGTRILVNGKCIPICGDYVMGDCSESSCSCKHGFTAPDCCKCAGGSAPVKGECPVPCIDSQNIFILMDRSSGLGNVELYNAMYMIEILTGALLRGTKNLTIDVLSYALSKDQITPLMNMAPKVSSGTVTEERCMSILADYEKNIANTFTNKPQNTLAGKTMELLEPLIQKGTHSTVITFSGTVSNYDETNNPVDRINSAIKTMKEKVGENNVKFFGASYIAENVIGVKTNDQVLREEQYKAEVLALAGGIPSQKAYIHDPVKLMQSVTEMLFNGGVLCQVQVDVLKKILSEDAAATYENYDICIHTKNLPCISKDPYNGCCKRESALDNKSTFLSAMRMLLEKLSN